MSGTRSTNPDSRLKQGTQSDSKIEVPIDSGLTIMTTYEDRLRSLAHMLRSTATGLGFDSKTEIEIAADMIERVAEKVGRINNQTKARRGSVNRWFALPIEDGMPRPRLFEGDVYRVRDERGEIRCATYERSPGGGHGFYDDGGEPIDAHAVEVGPSGGAACR